MDEACPHTNFGVAYPALANAFPSMTYFSAIRNKLRAEEHNDDVKFSVGACAVLNCTYNDAYARR